MINIIKYDLEIITMILFTVLVTHECDAPLLSNFKCGNEARLELKNVKLKLLLVIKYLSNNESIRLLYENLQRWFTHFTAVLRH